MISKLQILQFTSITRTITIHSMSEKCLKQNTILLEINFFCKMCEPKSNLFFQLRLSVYDFLATGIEGVLFSRIFLDFWPNYWAVNVKRIFWRHRFDQKNQTLRQKKITDILVHQERLINLFLNLGLLINYVWTFSLNFHGKNCETLKPPLSHILRNRY